MQNSLSAYVTRELRETSWSNFHWLLYYLPGGLTWSFAPYRVLPFILCLNFAKQQSPCYSHHESLVPPFSCKHSRICFILTLLSLNLFSSLPLGPWVWSAMQSFEILIWFQWCCCCWFWLLWFRLFVVDIYLIRSFTRVHSAHTFSLIFCFLSISRDWVWEYVSHNGHVRHVSLRSTILFVAFWGLSYMSYYVCVREWVSE